MLNRNLVGSLSVLGLTAALSSACGPQVPSTARLVGITFEPSGQDAVRTVTTIDFDGDGYPERVEVERDGVEVQEDQISFDGEGQLEEIVSHATSGTFSFTTTTTFDWSDGRVSRASSEGSGVDDPEGDNIAITTTSDRDFDYDDQGRLAGSSVTSTRGEAFEAAIFGFVLAEIEIDVERATEETYDWSDSGVLASVEATQDETTVTQIDDEESGRTTAATTQTIDFDYDDQNALEDLAFASSTTQVDEDMNETSSSSSASYDFRFSDEGQVTDVDLRLVNGSAEENDSFDVAFDDDGRIATLENNDGDVWEFEYDDEPVQGVTFGAAALPPVLDIAGRQALSVVGSPTHLVY